MRTNIVPSAICFTETSVTKESVNSLCQPDARIQNITREDVATNNHVMKAIAMEIWYMPHES